MTLTLMFGEGTIIQVKPDVSVADLGAEAVVLNTGSGKYYGVNEVGMRILELAKVPVSVADILDTLVHEYDVSVPKLKSDVQVFLSDMEANQLIEVV